MPSARDTLITATVFSSFGAAFLILSASTNSWEENDIRKEGLFRWCTGDCHTLDRNEEKFNAIRAMMILAVICQALALIMHIIHANTSRNTFTAIIVFAVFSAVAAICAYGMYAHYYHNSDLYNYGWSFIIGCIGVVFNIIGLICYGVAHGDGYTSL